MTYYVVYDRSGYFYNEDVGNVSFWDATFYRTYSSAEKLMYKYSYMGANYIMEIKPPIMFKGAYD
jgi:hypothetical protein